MPWRWLRQKGLDFALAYIHAEDKQTNYVDIGPVNKVREMCGYVHTHIPLETRIPNTTHPFPSP